MHFHGINFPKMTILPTLDAHHQEKQIKSRLILYQLAIGQLAIGQSARQFFRIKSNKVSACAEFRESNFQIRLPS